MTPHLKVYLKHFDYKPGEFIPCEICNSQACDIHHVNGRLGDKNNVDNLMAVCRDCHNKIHNTILFSREQVQEIHNSFLRTNKLYLFR